ncbi:FAD-dependent oxidoreductase [Streptomyces winkii]|uniref:FAD-dependent oxidoreductase n=1 Tax=Streptomyces winkii TaxID=3051178 RepID=UPI0028D1532D|nr:NAD(P)/FAD-dependent oxidoreductase [Streptomyces sp. DSM 40971]
MSGDHDVVVCGAGAGGLASARALGAIGLRVLLVDKQRAARPVAKGEVLQPGALRVLRRWGTDRLLTRNGALRLGQLTVRDAAGGPVMTLDYGRLPAADSSLLAHDHVAILDALTAGLGPNVELRRGVRVMEALRDATGRVVGVRLDEGGTTRRDVHAPLVVAADGIGSRLRRAADIGGSRGDYPHRLVALELHDAPWLPEDFSAYLTGRGLRLVYPLPGGRVRLYVQAEPGELRGLDRAGFARWSEQAVREVPALEALAGAAGAAAETRQLFPVARFLAARLTAPGLALVGESAYAVHPMAAQGMNSAITSAAALADQLDARLTPAGWSDSPEQLAAEAVDAALRDYEQDRLPVLGHAGRTSANAARMVTDLTWPGRVLGRRAVRCTGANPRLLHTITYNMAGLGPRPLTLLDRLHQIGLLPDPRAHRVPSA